MKSKVNPLSGIFLNLVRILLKEFFRINLLLAFNDLIDYRVNLVFSLTEILLSQSRE